MAVRDKSRERFLDAIRTIAVVRVILWHAFGLAFITYVIAAVPAMFFVTGSLLARSIDRHGGGHTVIDRLRRMLPPLWMFTAVAFCVMAVAYRYRPNANTSVTLWHALVWLFPIADPHGSAWEHGWLSSPLWYLRALLWMVLAAPLLLRAVRRSPKVTFASLLAVVFALDLAARHPAWPLQQTRVPWLTGDFALYAVFVSLGFLYRDGVLNRIRPRGWFAITGGVGVLAAVWVLTQPVPDGVVNDSHPAHLLVGLAWLALALALRGPIERLAAHRVVSPAIDAMNSRSLSVYLWHSTAIILSYQLLWHLPMRLPYGMFTGLLLVGIASMTFALVTAFGWIEDLAAKRNGALWATHVERHARPASAFAMSGVALLCTVGMLSVAAVPANSAATTSAAKLVTPSRQPPTPSVGASNSSTGAAISQTVAAATQTNGALNAAFDSVVQAWLRATGVSGAQVAVSVDGAATYANAIGTDADGKPLSTTSTFDTWSITKTYTAAIAYQLVDNGTLTLDGPLPAIATLPTFDAAHTTLRMLLDHSTGLVNYRDTAAYAANPNMSDPATAAAAAIAAPRLFVPGTAHTYSSTNYLIIGLLLEQVTGRAYDELLSDHVLVPQGLTNTIHVGATPGNPNFSTGGVTTDIVDLNRWADLYLRDHVGISDASYQAMTTIDSASAMGAGVIGYCPCTSNLDGSTAFAAIGYAGATTEIQYAAGTGVTISVNLSQSMWEPATRYQDMLDLFTALRAVRAAHAAK